MNYRFSIFVVKEDDYYIAKCMENSVSSQGTTIENALENVKEALELFLEDNEVVVLKEQPLMTTIEISA